MPRSIEVRTPEGRTLEVHATDPLDSPALTLFWHHGSPHTGRLVAPMVELARARDIQVVTYARPGYGSSTWVSGRNVASAAADVRTIADTLGIGHFAVIGYSGGGPHALACAAILPDRVLATVTLAAIAPYTDEFDWFAGMHAPGALQAARQGWAARRSYAETEQFDGQVFTATDWSALGGRWAAVGRDAEAAGAKGNDGLIDDDTAFATDWGFDPASIAGPVLVVQGGEDRMVPLSHGESMARRIPAAEFWLRPHDGHISILNSLPDALDWLLETTGGR